MSIPGMAQLYEKMLFLINQNKKLRNALVKYGQHINCNLNDVMAQYPQCTCGLFDIEKECAEDPLLKNTDKILSDAIKKARGGNAPIERQGFA